MLTHLNKYKYYHPHLAGPDAPDAGDTILSTRDEAKVLEELVSAQNKSHVLGLALNVPSETLVGIKSQNDPKERLDDVIREFLRGDNPLPTWRVIAGALRRRSVGMSGLALHIERKYCGIVPLEPKSFRPQHSRNRTYLLCRPTVGYLRVRQAELLASSVYCLSYHSSGCL